MTAAVRRVCAQSAAGRGGAALLSRELDVAVASDGAVTAMWVQRTGLDSAIHARVFHRGSWGVDAPVYDAEPAFDIHVGAFAGGQAAVAFRYLGGAGTAAAVASCLGNGLLCTSRDVETGASATSVAIATDGADQGVVAVVTLDGFQRDVRAGRIASSAGALPAVDDLVAVTPSSVDPIVGLVASVGDGTATLAWVTGSRTLAALAFPTTAVPNRIAPLVVDQQADPVIDRSLAIAGDGPDAVLAWTRDLPGPLSTVSSGGVAVGAVRAAADAIGPARLRQVPPALSVAPGSGRVVLAAARGNRIVTRVRFADEAKWRQRLLPVERGVTMTALVGAADARGGAVLAWVATTRTEERLRFARLAAAPEAARPRVTRRAVTASVSSPIPGRARLVGRYRVRGQSVIGCRSAAVSLTANVPRNARCVLTARARADRAVRALRIDIAVTVRPRTGRPISATTTVAVPRRR